MSNDYYNATVKPSRFTLGRAETIGSVFEAIAAGFDKLPSQLALAQDRATFLVDTGTANTHVVTMSPVPAAYAVGMSLRVQIATTNTGAATINVNGLGARAIKRVDGTDPEASDITAGDIVWMIYNGTDFIHMGPYRTHLVGIAQDLGADLTFGGSPTFNGTPTFNGGFNFTGTIEATAFDGDGSALTNVNAATVDGIEGADIVQTSRTITAGTGLTGGGDLSADRTLAVDVTTSATDTTSGRILKVGDFGLGTTSPPVLDDVDATDTVSGFYTVSNPSAGSPPDLFAFLHVLRRGGSHITQVLYSTPGASEVPTQYIRFYNGTSWSAWRAFVERGSNSNGEYTRLADGTQICLGESGVITTDEFTAGSMFGRFATGNTFPAAFASAPNVVVSGRRTSGTSSHLAGVSSISSTAFSAYLLAASSTSTGSVLWQAAGRWF